MHFYCWFINAGEALNELCWQEEEEGEGAVPWLPVPALRRGLGASAATAATLGTQLNSLCLQFSFFF